MTSLFSNSAATGPPMSWPDPMSYPSLLGVTNIKNVNFAEFHNQVCDSKTKESHALVTHVTYGDLLHPITLSGVKSFNVDEGNKVILFVLYEDMRVAEGLIQL